MHAELLLQLPQDGVDRGLAGRRAVTVPAMDSGAERLPLPEGFTYESAT